MQNPLPPSDEQLLADVREGSETAFRLLLERHQNRVFNVVAGFLPIRQDAEDVSQEVFMEIWRSAGQFRQEARVSTWIYRVAVSKALQALRHRTRTKRAGFFRALFGLDHPEAQQKASAIVPPDLNMENKERWQILHQNLAKLPESQRTALVLQKIEGLGQSEIAAVLGLSVGAVEGLLARAKDNLRQHLETCYRQQEL